MQTFLGLSVIFVVSFVECSVIPTTTLVRSPSFDSAIIKSDRVGGSFSYSTVEGHAYAAVSPIVQRITQPTGVSYTAHQVHLGHIDTPVAVSQPIYAEHTVVNQPIFSLQHLFSNPGVITSPVFPQTPIISGIANIPNNPVISGVATSPIVGGIPSTPVVQANPAPTPVQGTIVDADTVAVESA